MDEVERLLELAQRGLRAGVPDYARGYFEKVLQIEPSNQEALEGLAQLDRASPKSKTKPSRRVPTTSRLMHGLAAILVLIVVVTLVWIAYSTFIEPRREVAVAPIATAISTETPEPTPTLKPLSTPTQKEPTPTSVVLAETIFGEPVQKQIYFDYMEARKSSVGDKDVYEEVAQQWATTVDVVKAIAVEGFKKNWVTPTPVPPTPTPTPVPPTPTPTPGLSTEERVYLADSQSVGTAFFVAYFALEDLVIELDQNPGLLVDQGWQNQVESLFTVMRSACRALNELNPPSARLERFHQALVYACGQSDRAADLFAQGMDNADIEKIAEGWVELMLGKAYIEKGP